MVNPLEKVKEIEENSKKEVERYEKKVREEIFNLKEGYSQRIKNISSLLMPDVEKIKIEREKKIKELIKENQETIKLDLEKIRNIKQEKIINSAKLIKKEFLNLVDQSN